MICDTDYWPRMELLYQLTQRSPNKPMRKLQRESLKYYPLYTRKHKKLGYPLKQRLNVLRYFARYTNK